MRKQKNRKLTSRNLEVLKMYCDGETFTTIKETFHISKTTINAIAYSANVVMRNPSFCSYKEAHDWVVKARQDFKARYEAPQSPKSKSASSVAQDC